MANEKRLIVAHDLWTDIMMLPHNGDMISSEEVVQAIMDAPIVDAVEVVHCCDCRNCTAFQQFADSEVILFCEKWKGHPKVDFTDFCSYGERREGE